MRDLELSTRLFIVALAAGFVLRVASVFLPDHLLNSDHAVVYLMARHATRGELTPFFWGQGYGGSLLPWLAGLAMKATGPSLQVLAIVGILFWLAATVLFRQLVRTTAEALVADLAGVLVWFPGWVILYVSVAEGGFYGPSLAVAFAAMWLSVRSLEHRSTVLWAALGGLVGLALWLSPMAFALSFPAAALAVARDRRWRHLGLAAVCAIPGAALWMIGTADHRADAYSRVTAASPMNIVRLVTKSFPAAFPGGTETPWSWLMALALAAAVAFLIFYAVTRHDHVAGVVAAGTLSSIVVLGLGTGPIPLDEWSSRYAAFLFPALALGASLGIGTLAQRVVRAGSALAVGIAAFVGTAAMVGVNAATLDVHGPSFSPEPAAVVRFLRANDVTAAYGSYWLAYALTAAVDERITIAALAPRRYIPYEIAAAHPDRTAVVVFANGPNDLTLQRLHRRGLLPDYERSAVDQFAIYIFTTRTDIYAAASSAGAPFGAF